MKLYIFILAAFLLSSCHFIIDTNTYDLYYKCFFLGETSFLIEGEIFEDALKSYYDDKTKPPLAKKIPFDSLVARISSKSGTSDYYTEWEIPAIKLSESKFQLPVDITANGITINKDIITDNIFKSRVPIGLGTFPEFELRFFINDRKYNSPPLFQEVVNNKYLLSGHTYLYVPVPVNASGTYATGEVNTEIQHYDLNYSKPGWYKVIGRYYREIDNDPKFSTGEDTNFILYE
jgi:hypothetical protein